MCRWRSITRARRLAALPAFRAPATAGRGAAGVRRAPVLANQQLEVRALFVGELEEDLLALGVLERLAVALEEAVRPALARMPIISACRSSTPWRSCSAPAANRPLAAPLKNRNVGRDSSCGSCCEQLAVARLERAEVLLLFVGELLEHAAAARVARERGRARVELEAAALGGDRDPQRVAREEQLGRRAVDRRRGRPGPAGLARAVDLQHALARA